MTHNILKNINNEEQDTLGQMQASFNNAIGKSNVSQTNMISSYISANTSRRACYLGTVKLKRMLRTPRQHLTRD